MASQLIRDAAKDHLLTPKNSALLIIDYQPVQVNSIASMDLQRLIDNIVGVAKAGRAFGLPIVHSTVNVKTALNKPAMAQARGAMNYLRVALRGNCLLERKPLLDGCGVRNGQKLETS